MKKSGKHFWDSFYDEEDDEAVESSETSESSDKAADIVSQDIARAIEEKTGRTEADDGVVRDYEIGGFHFDTYYEYRNAEEDIKRINIINKNIDIRDPEAAVRLYNEIRDGKIVFKSPIGDQFFNHIGDVVADRSVDLLQDKKTVEEAEGQVKGQKHLAIVFISLAVVAFSYFAISELHDMWQARKLAKLQKETNSKVERQLDQDSSVRLEGNTNEIPQQGSVDPSTLTMLPEFQDAYNTNNEMVGWLEIPDTDVNYPVVCKMNDNKYYLTHAFDNSDDKNGSIFMDYRSDIVNPTTNTIIYGHHMKSGLMFGKLDQYLDKDYMEAHKLIHFDTLYEKRTYQIVAVCLSEVQYQDEDSYRYYDFIQARTQADFDDFLSNVQACSVFDGEIDIKNTDQLLTLSTCNHYVKDGRQFIVAKRIG